MLTTLSFALVALTYKSAYGQHDKSALCRTWNNVQEDFQNKMKEYHVSCTVTGDCTGLNCSGVVYGSNITSAIQLYDCENPANVEFFVNIPKLNINNFKKRIYHNDYITLYKNLRVEFEVERKNKDLKLGLYVHYLNQDSFPLLRTRFPVIRPVEFHADCSFSESSSRQAVKENHNKSNKKVKVTIEGNTRSTPSAAALISLKGLKEGFSNCTIYNSTCGEYETCKQINKDKPDGICICRTNYTRDTSGKCIYDYPEKTSSVSLLLTAILVPIFVILLIAGAVFVSIRFRVCHHLRRRLRVQVYEHVLLGEDDDDDDEDLRNPVA